MPQSAQEWKPSSVGIALAAYQPNPAWLAEQLASLVAQTHTDWHCVITLDSPLQDIQNAPVLQPYLNDDRFTWIENGERLGARRNFEKAIHLTAQRGVDLISFADQDDIWLPEKISESIKAITVSGPMTLVATDAYLFSGDNVMSQTVDALHRITNIRKSLEEIIIYPSVTGFTVLLDAQLVLRHPQIPVPMRYHDHWFSVVATAYKGVFRCALPLALYRQHEGNTVGISSIRNELGLGAVPKQKQDTDRMRGLAQQHFGAASIAAQELPVDVVRRAFLRWRLGWILLMVKVIVHRSFTERLLVVQAFRAINAQLTFFPSQTSRMQELWARVLIRERLFSSSIIVVGAFTVVITALNIAVVLELIFGLKPAFWVGLSMVSMALPVLKHLRHTYPNASLLLIGLSALAAAAARLVSDSALVSAVTFALPILWHVAYRLRWRGDTGY
jgi:hypothetical protein